jgi:hypothetical protein
LEFEEVDETFTGDKVEWGDRSVDDKCFYVAYMKDPQAAQVSYWLEVNGEKVYQRVDDSEKLWYMWMAGCFSGERDVDEDILKTFLFYAAEGDLARILIEDIDLDDVKLTKLAIEVAEM